MKERKEAKHKGIIRKEGKNEFNSEKETRRKYIE